MARSWSELVEEGLKAQENGPQWVLGDLALEVETDHGEASLERYAADIEVEYNSLRRYRVVSSAYPQSDIRISNWSLASVFASQDDRLKLLAGGNPKTSQPWTVAEARKLVNKRRAFVKLNTGENEWYTPAAYVEAARAVMGGIDLDPASTEKANEVVKADRYITALDEPDGLSAVWGGRVFMNPPYDREVVAKWCTRLAAEHAGGAVTEAIVLVNNSTDSSWFQELLAVSAAVCFPLYRIKFWHPAGKESNPLQGQAFFYLGENVEAFREQFSQFGGVVRVLCGKQAAVPA